MIFSEKTEPVIDMVLLFWQTSRKRRSQSMAEKHLTEAERYYIEVSLRTKKSVRQIAEDLSRSRVCIYNEIKRGTVTLLNTDLTERKEYCADAGERIHVERGKLRGAPLKIGKDIHYADFIENKIKKDRFSPRAVLSYIKTNDLKFNTSVSEYTIYLYIQKGVFCNLTYKDLPCGKRKTAKLGKHSCVSLKNTANSLRHSIETRPSAIKERQKFGHWELDTVVGGKKTSKECLLVFTERKTRSEILRKIKAKDMDSVVEEIDRLYFPDVRKFKETFKTITCDNGTEFFDASGIQKENRTILYYCHPYRAGERGSNENANKLIRRWIPKGTDISKLTDEYIRFVQDWINNYPRKIFGGMSSNQYMESLGISLSY